MSKRESSVTVQELLQLIASRYADSADDFRLSVGHFERPDPDKPIGLYNLPEFCGYVSINMADVRAWIAAELDPAPRGSK